MRIISSLGISVLAGAVVAACSAGGDGPGVGEGPGSGSGGGPGSGVGGYVGFIEPPPLLDVPYTEIEQEFWIPPKFTGTGCQGTPGLWGQAVQRALWFFHVQKSGPDVSQTYVQWRGDSHEEDAHIKLISGDPNGVDIPQAYITQWKSVLDPDGNDEIDMSGGMYDAGDFIKIGITENYAAHTLAWTMWEFPDAFRNTGLEAEALGVLKWHADYFMKNTYVVDKTVPNPWEWEVVAYAHDIAGSDDHTCGWMPPELRRTRFCPRQAFLATKDARHANITAGAAAALALTGWLFRHADPDYAKKCLDHAIALYEFAKVDPSSNWSTAGLYTSEDAYDDLTWAAIWLYEVLPEPGRATASELYASHKEQYLLDLITPGQSWIENWRNGAGLKLDVIKQGGAPWTESWTYCWNSLRSGALVKVAEILARSGTKYGGYARGFQAIAREDSLNWVTTGNVTPDGYTKKVPDTWGTARYNSAAQLVALTYAKAFPADVIPNKSGWEALAGQNTAEVLRAWAKRQSEYLLGDNTRGESYMMGFQGLGTFSSPAAHHAATHASIYGECGKPEESKHQAHGALVSGPNAGDDHSTDRCDFGANEITIDYNASFLGALAGNYHFNGAGQCPDTDFPPLEPPQDEFYTESKLNTTGVCSDQVEITLVNETAHPPRYDETLTVRYYFDATELQAKGLDPMSVKGSIIYQNFADQPTSVTGPHACKLNTSTYYFEFAYPWEFWGRQVKLTGPRTVLFEIGTGTNGCTWDSSNDWSINRLTSEVAKSPLVPAYRMVEAADGSQQRRLVWGAEPECDEPPKIIIPPTILY